MEWTFEPDSRASFMIRKTSGSRCPRVTVSLPRLRASLYTSRADPPLALMLSVFLSSKLLFRYGKEARVFGAAGYPSFNTIDRAPRVAAEVAFFGPKPPRR